LIAVHTGSLFGTVTAMRTGAGLVLGDTGRRETARRRFAAIRRGDDRPMQTGLYTHGHIDHRGGARRLDEEAAAAKRPQPRIIAHRHVVARFTREDDTRGLTTTINGHQFNQADCPCPRAHRVPDETYADHCDLALACGRSARRP
jgi:glyoxylase-like metal-dependent hydrolase (beta-lactamase superfamily II)